MSRSLASLIGFGEEIEATDSEVEFDEREEVEPEFRSVVVVVVVGVVVVVVGGGGVGVVIDNAVAVGVIPTNGSCVFVVDVKLFV
jgi:hypothetical protein